MDKTVPACSDTGPGTAATPFCTLAKGVSRLQPGYTLYIGSGTYPETIKPAVSGAAGNPITITAWPGRSPVIGTGVTNGAYVSTRSYVVISNLTFTGTVGDGIYVTKSGHITVSGNKVTGAGKPVQGGTPPGISIRATNDSLISGNTTDHNYGHGIYVTNTSTYTSLAPMQSATGQEANGIQADPKFEDPTNWTLQLTEGSVAIDRGDAAVSDAQDHDILGNSWVRDPNADNSHATGPRTYDDLGAYEYQPDVAPTPTGPTAQLSVSPASGTAPVQVTADASGSSDPQGQSLSYAFDFGDGTTTGVQNAATAAHTYATAGTYTVKVTVTDTSGLSDSTTQAVTVNAAPSYVGQIGTALSSAAVKAGSVTVGSPVKAGDMVVVTVQESSGTNKPVTVTDDAGNTYSAATSQSDSTGAKLTVLYGTATKPLAAGAKITANFSSNTTYRLAADELAGVTTLDRTATATGTASTFSSGVTKTTTAPRELVLGVVALTGGRTAPSWSAGWSLAGSSSAGSSYLSRAYRTTTALGTFAETGSATGTWPAGVITFR